VSVSESSSSRCKFLISDSDILHCNAKILGQEDGFDPTSIWKI
jgi:hypothetical protein